MSEVTAFNDDLYSGVNDSDLFPAGNEPNAVVAEEIEKQKSTVQAFIPAAKIISNVIAVEKANIFDLREFLKALPNASSRTESGIKDEIRARELYSIFLDGLDRTISSALSEVDGADDVN